MTELLYHTDSYTKAFDAKVTSVLSSERAIILDWTAFYPGGGGSPVTSGH
jgi:misacylated tRNA(Ala) deacylase